MPMVAYAVITVIPIAILVWYYLMYSNLGASSLRGTPGTGETSTN